ncbi:hypothetical protein NPS70_08200 [Streptomyces sp. C10-9-1]|uniref:hypothetical protein n=1 Tax=Streptomyces sp. C10-9-1 TaxID=1859285 RepID=UPI002112F7D5|nr:hypothetical protein [Streptomyces sp. C10-9-1]MCQ6553175.1 hypothetical protein [Streptomyces sp. C10-9-1]
MDAQHQTTTWLRLGLVAMLWSVLPWAAPDQVVHAVLALAVVTVGTVASHVHARPWLIEYLDQLPGMRRLVSHLTGTRGRATVDLPGLLEGAGILIAGLAYVGPWGVAGISREAEIVALVSVVAYTHSVFLNVVLDPGFYAPSIPVELGPDRSSGAPPLPLQWVRHAVPPGLTLIGATLFTPDWNPELAAIPIGLRVLLSASFLLLWVAWTCFDQVLSAAAATVKDCEQVVRLGAAQDLHSLAKNSIVSILTAVGSPHYQRSEVRGLTRNALVQLEEVRRAWLSHDTTGAGGRLEDLWEAAIAVLTREWRERCHLDEAARDIKLHATDYQLVRRILSDLVTNALQANAEHVTIKVAMRHWNQALSPFHHRPELAKMKGEDSSDEGRPPRRRHLPHRPHSRRHHLHRGHHPRHRSGHGPRRAPRVTTTHTAHPTEPRDTDAREEVRPVAPAQVGARGAHREPSTGTG